jgi:glycine/D-amino acid oxidase-like deaminating enzyme
LPPSVRAPVSHSPYSTVSAWRAKIRFCTAAIPAGADRITYDAPARMCRLRSSSVVNTPVHVVDRGVLPVLIDPERPGQGTSTGSFASISAFGKDPVAWFQLACAGMSGWQRFAHRLGADVGLRRAGEVRWASDPEGGRRLARQVADARGRGYPVRPVDPAEVERLLPGARIGPVAAASFAPNDGQVEPPLVLQACRRVLVDAGARLVAGRARLRLDDDGVQVEVGTEVLRPRTCVLAAGAEAVQVAAAVGLEVPTVASPGMLVQTRPLPPLTERVVYVPGGPGPAVHLRQRADGSVLVGERSQETVATEPGLGHARALLAQAARFFPPLAGVGVDRWWLAYRPCRRTGCRSSGRCPGWRGCIRPSPAGEARHRRCHRPAGLPRRSPAAA